MDPEPSPDNSSQREPPRAGALITTGFAALTRPPFRSLWFLMLLIAVVSATIAPGTDDFAIGGSLVLAGISLYLDIATILAAAADRPETSVDHWIRNAFRRRTFWRFFLTGILTDIAVALGLLGLVVGGFVVGAMVAVAAPAVVLERHLPVQALGRSAEITRRARGAMGIVFGLLVIVPTIALPALYLLDITRSVPAQIASGVIGATIGTASTIALTRAFVLLGGGGTEETVVEETPAA